jgi:ABC-2 type transport system ATP-binding protein
VQDLAGLGAPVQRMEVVGPTLDDVFLDLTGRSLRESNETTDPTDESTQSTETEGAAA